MLQDSGVAELAHQPLSLSRAASASPLPATSRNRSGDDYLDVSCGLQPFYNTLPRAGDTRRHYLSAGHCLSIYSQTDPHYLSAAASAEAAAAESASALLGCPSECDVTLPGDASWSSDHLYCNMASVDPLPSLPPRISRRCHSV